MRLFLLMRDLLCRLLLHSTQLQIEFTTQGACVQGACHKEGAYYDLKSKKHHTNSKYDVEERATYAWIIPSMH